jgi:hypothetical protein
MHLAKVEGLPLVPVRAGHEELATEGRRCTRRFEADSEDGVGLECHYRTVRSPHAGRMLAADDQVRAALAKATGGGGVVVALSRPAG